ncbi:MAG: hypothetical protein AAFO83_04010 [Cyanobacteria bacterium J06607_13]
MPSITSPTSEPGDFLSGPFESRNLLEAKPCWFVPWNELSDLDSAKNPDYGKLRKVDAGLQERDQFLQEGSPFTISLESFCVQESHDRDSHNDLLVRSYVRYGDELKTETINFFGTNIPAKQVVGDLEFEHIFARREFAEDARIWLAIEITEVDKGIEEAVVTSGLAKIRARFGAVFSALIPFSTVAGVALNTLEDIQKLRTPKQQNRQVLFNQIDLYAQALSGGDAPLRSGAYIFFSEPVQGVQYRLGSGFKLKRAAMKDKDVPVAHDYAVVKVTPGFVRSGTDPDEILKNQQLAMVLSQEDAEATEDERSAHYNFLSGLVESADKLKALDYYREVTTAVKMFGHQPTEAQKQRLIDIRMALGNYISD